MVTLAGFLGGVFPWMDAFSHLRMQYAIAAAALAGAGTLAGLRRFVPVAAVLVVVNLIAVAPCPSGDGSALGAGAWFP